MKIHWKKLGLLYCPSGTKRHPKLLTHAANPLPVLLNGDVYRVFYSSRDVQNRSSVGAVDVDIVKNKIVQEFDKPFFEYGPNGSFYADGVSIGNCYRANGTRYMLFMGWQTPKDSHWRGDVGRLIVNSDLTLELASETPFMSCDAIDPISLSYPWVMRDQQGHYQMWYGSTLTWDAGNGEMIHAINHATSPDGDNWVKQGLSVPYELGIAQAYSRPTVVYDADGFHMWFSFRSGNGQKYRIGYATSDTGRHWDLSLADAGIDVAEQGWDSDMIEYPFVLDHNGRRYMFYNGNGYGLTGFGLAVREWRP